MADIISPHPGPQTDIETEAVLEQTLSEIRRLNGLIQQDQTEIDRIKAESSVITDRTDDVLSRIRLKLDVLERTA